MVSLKVLQLELSPPHTPHLSSCFEEPTAPSQPTFCLWGNGKFNDTSTSKHLQLSCSKPINVSHLTLPPHTHTVRILVWTACAIQEHSLHEDHVSCLLGLAMQLAAFVSWRSKKQTQKLNYRNYCQNYTLAIHLHDFIFTSNMWLFFMFWMNSVVSVTPGFIVSVWLILQLHEPPETKPGSSSQWRSACLLHHVYCTWTSSKDLFLLCFDTEKKVADVLL